MPEVNDMELMREYADRNSDASFEQLVQRHINLVYSVALRFTGHPADAQDVAQAVFIILARKAASLPPRTILTGWLYETTRFTAMKFLRTSFRHQARQQEAYMQSTLNDSNNDSVWNQLEPLLEDAMTQLNEKERTLLALRFFEDKSGLEAAAILGIQEGAAHKRLNRAVEKLRGYFSKRGIDLPSAILTAAISANSVQAAPVGLAVALSATTLKGAVVAASVTALVNGTIKTIAMTTLQKTLIAVSLVAAVGIGIYEAREVSILRTKVQALQQKQTPLTLQIQQLTGEGDQAKRQLAALRDENERLNRNTAELLKLRGEVGALRNAMQDAKQSETEPIQVVAKAWLAKVDILKKWIEQRPEQKIPEFQYLQDYDWLDAVKTSNMLGDYAPGNAMGGLREAAKRQFAHEMSNALRHFVEEHNGDLPADLSQLNTYFQQPMNDAILKSYKLLHTGKLAGLPKNEWLVSEIAPPFDRNNWQRMMIRTNDYMLVRREK